MGARRYLGLILLLWPALMPAASPGRGRSPEALLAQVLTSENSDPEATRRALVALIAQLSPGATRRDALAHLCVLTADADAGPGDGRQSPECRCRCRCGSGGTLPRIPAGRSRWHRRWRHVASCARPVVNMPERSTISSTPMTCTWHWDSRTTRTMCSTRWPIFTPTPAWASTTRPSPTTGSCWSGMRRVAIAPMSPPSTSTSAPAWS